MFVSEHKHDNLFHDYEIVHLLRIKVFWRRILYLIQWVSWNGLLTYFNCPKVATTRKLRPLSAANSENNGGRYFRNSTVT